MKEPAIETSNLTIGYTKSRNKEGEGIQTDLNISLYSGELTCLLGSNGVGKSTLLRTLSNMQATLEGDIFLFDKNIKEYSKAQLSMFLGLVLTDKTSIGGYTVREVVSLGRYPYTGFLGKLSNKDNAIVEKAMEDVLISNKSDSYVSELSDGEKQKVMIAKALAQECPIIILDEPTAFLDVVNRFEIMTLLQRLAVDQKKAILLSTHDMELAFTLANRLWVMAKDKPLKTGITEDIILSGTIDEYIGNKNIYFDPKVGRFISGEVKNKTIFLSAENNLEYCWTKNFLEKKGYYVVSNQEYHLLTIDIKTPLNFTLQNNEGLKNLFFSFEELSDFLDQEKALDNYY